MERSSGPFCMFACTDFLPCRVYMDGMTFKKPFRAVPVQLGAHYQARRQRGRRMAAAKYTAMLTALGLTGGAAVYLTRPQPKSEAVLTPVAPAPDASNGTPVDVLPPPMTGAAMPMPIHEPLMSAAQLDAQQPAAVRALPDAPARRVHVASTATGGWSYPNCRAARGAGAAPLYRGQPGYGAHMDGDDDGIACEPIRR